VRKVSDRSNAGVVHSNSVRDMPAFIFGVALPCGREGHLMNWCPPKELYQNNI
jgi:hypothetical protein